MTRNIKIFCSILAVFCLMFFGERSAQAETRGGVGDDYFCDNTGGAWNCFVKPGGTANFQVKAADPGDLLYFLLYWEGAAAAQSPATCPANLATCISSDTWYSISHSFINPNTYTSYAKACDDENACGGVSNTIITHISQFANPNLTAPSYVVKGNNITYTVSFNVGAASMYGAKIVLNLPGGATYVSNAGSCSGVSLPGSYGAGKVTWDLLSPTRVDLPLGSSCQFSAIVGTASSACDSTLTSSVVLTAFNAATPSVANAASQVTCPENWWQTFWGDIHAQSSILNSEPGSNRSADFMITAGSGISGARSREFFGKEIAPYHQLFFFAVDYNGLKTGKYGQVKNTVNGDWQGTGIVVPTQTTKSLWWTADNPSANVWYKNGNLKISENKKELFLERGGTVLVEGNLGIDGDLFYDPNPNPCATSPAVDCRLKLPSVGFVVTGNLEIGEEVKHIAGNFYVLGDVYTSNTEDSELIIEGLLVARGALNLQREYEGDGDDPAEIARYDGRALVNPPPGFSDPATILPTWAWIKP